MSYYDRFKKFFIIDDTAKTPYSVVKNILDINLSKRDFIDFAKTNLHFNPVIEEENYVDYVLGLRETGTSKRSRSPQGAKSLQEKINNDDFRSVQNDYTRPNSPIPRVYYRNRDHDNDSVNSGRTCITLPELRDALKEFRDMDSPGETSSAASVRISRQIREHLNTEKIKLQDENRTLTRENKNLELKNKELTIELKNSKHEIERLKNQIKQISEYDISFEPERSKVSFKPTEEKEQKSSSYGIFDFFPF